MTSYSTSARSKRIPHLQTDEDLTRDQLSFFRSENVLPPSDNDAADEADLAMLSLSRNAPTPTSNLLAPIKERTVRRRSRIRKDTAPGCAFPAVHLVDSTEKSVFRRRAAEKTAKPAHSAPEPVKDDTIGMDGVPRIEDMSPQQIREALDEIYATMDEDTINFFRERGRVKAFYDAGSEHTAVFETATSVDSDPLSTNDTHLPLSHIAANESRKDSTASETNNSSPTLAPPIAEKNRSSGDPTAEHLAREELLVPTKESLDTPAIEQEKRQWMQDATEEIPTEDHLNSLLQSAIDNLGEAARPRYDLSGNHLSPEQIATLPTYHALHHHGTEPANAGYTLPDILLLTRSTVLSQRVLSLRILAAVIAQNREAVLSPLIDSGALALVFAPFPSESAFDTSLTNQDAYLHCVEVLVKPHCALAEDELEQGLYFTSRFYSQAVQQSVVQLLEVLAKSDCVKTIVRMAKAAASCDDGLHLALRSLNVVREIVSRSSKACEELLSNQGVISILQALALGPTMLNPPTALLSCDVLSQIVVHLGWKGPQMLSTLKKYMLSDDFLSNICIHLSWLFRDSPNSLGKSQLQAANGAVRLFRSALSFECGITTFATVISSVCILAQSDEQSSAEAYLALEAYVHALYTKATNKSEETEANSTVFTEEFVKDQLSGLVPIALSAATLFSSNREGDISRRKAAAGHFVGTILAIAPIPLDKAVAARILNESTMTSRKLASARIGDDSELAYAQTVASVSHACARILSKVKLDPSYARAEVDALYQGASIEHQYCHRFHGRLPWRPIANACAEWIGALSRVDYSKRTIEFAIALLPLLSEPQVVIDLLARSILRAQVLQVMDPSIPTELAQKCSQDLLPLSLTKLSSISNGDLTTEQEGIAGSRDTDVVLVTIEGLLELWIQETVLDSFLYVVKMLFDHNLIDNVQLLYILLCALSSVHVRSQEELVRFTFSVGSVVAAGGHQLIQNQADTVVSATSTAGNPRLCDSLLSLAEHLVSRGPIRQPKAVNVLENVDYIASIVLSIMFEQTADTSLRIALWNKTIRECGGGMLYQNACMFSSKAPTREDPVEIQSAYTSARLEGILAGERCPSLLANIIASRTIGKQ